MPFLYHNVAAKIINITIMTSFSYHCCKKLAICNVTTTSKSALHHHKNQETIFTIPKLLALLCTITTTSCCQHYYNWLFLPLPQQLAVLSISWLFLPLPQKTSRSQQFLAVLTITTTTNYACFKQYPSSFFQQYNKKRPIYSITKTSN
jgi:hypothetical protein